MGGATGGVSLSEIINEVAGRKRRLTIVDPADESVVRELCERFQTRNVAVEVTADAPNGDHPSGYAVVSDPETGEVLAAADLDHVGAADGIDELAAAFDSTLFTSFDIDRMMAATREVEDRAWRVGEGRLHAGFQRPAAITEQVSVYEDLTTSDLEINAYAAPSPDLPDLEGVTVHEDDCEEIRQSWFVVFDGGPERINACALLAEERGDDDERRFYGFWTYDPELVDRIDSYLSTRYLAHA